MKIIGKKWLSCWLYVMIAVTGIIIGIAIRQYHIETPQESDS